MKLLLVTSEFDPFRGGIGTYTRELAVAASKLGHQVTVLAPDYGQDQAALDKTFDFEIVRYRGGVSSMRGLPARIMTLWSFSRKRPDFDCVHAVCWPFYIPLALSLYRSKVRCLLTFHGTEINLMAAPRRAALLNLVRFWEPWAEMIGNSRFTAALLARTFPEAKADLVKAVPLAVSPRWAEGRTPRPEARAALGIGDRDLLVVTLGRVVERKGHLVLAEAIAQLPPAIKDRVLWRIVGVGKDKAYLEALEQAVGALGEKAALTGPLSDVDLKLLLSAADLFCLPGYQDAAGEVEGFGLAYLEAGAFGVPSVGTDIGGVPDAVAHGVTGLLAPPRDVPALARALTEVLQDDALRRRLAKAAETHAVSATWLKVAQATYAQTNTPH